MIVLQWRTGPLSYHTRRPNFKPSHLILVSDYSGLLWTDISEQIFVHRKRVLPLVFVALAESAGDAVGDGIAPPKSSRVS